MTDRELLEAAARVYWPAGSDVSIRWLELDQAIGYIDADNQDHNGQDRERVWNPLEDDGDALRLSIDRNIELEFGAGFVNAGSSLNDGEWHLARVEFNGDKRAATRRAIVLAVVRAAAAMAPEIAPSDRP